MPRSKVIALAMLAIIGLLPSLPAMYNARIGAFNASTVLGLAGFYAVSVALAIHQVLFERGQ